jgi:dTMP kinase
MMPPPINGRLLVIEGPDFVGRSTHVRLLTTRLEAHGVAVLTLGLKRSPLLGDLLKRAGPALLDFGGHTRALLYATDLHDQIEHHVLPALEAGFVVVADRYHYTVAIRESVRKVNRQWLDSLFEHVPEPSGVVVLSASPRRQLDRLLRDSGVHQLTRYEAGSDLHFSRSPTVSFLKYQGKLHKEFHALAKARHWPVIDSERPVPDVHEAIWAAFAPCLGGMLQPIGT